MLTIDEQFALLENADTDNLTELLKLIGLDTHGKFIGYDFTGADFSNQDFNHADLSYSILRNTTMTNTNLSNATFYNADLSNSILTSTNFAYANLKDVKLNSVQCDNTNFYNASLDGAKISNTDLTKTNLQGTNLNNISVCNSIISFETFRKVANTDGELHSSEIIFTTRKNKYYSQIPPILLSEQQIKYTKDNRFTTIAIGFNGQKIKRTPSKIKTLTNLPYLKINKQKSPPMALKVTFKNSSQFYNKTNEDFTNNKIVIGNVNKEEQDNRDSKILEFLLKNILNKAPAIRLDLDQIANTFGEDIALRLVNMLGSVFSSRPTSQSITNLHKVQRAAFKAQRSTVKKKS